MNICYRSFLFVSALGGVCLLFSLTAMADESEESESLIIEDRPESEEEAIELFTRKFVWAEDQTHIGVNQYGQEVSRSHSTQFYQGRHKRPLNGVEFYETLQRPDLADEYRSGSKRRSRLIWSGLGMMLAGPVVMIGGGFLLFNELDSSSDDVNWALGGSVMGVGALLTLIGPGLMLGGSMVNPDPVQAHEAREIVESYNLRLIDELEIDSDALPQEEDEEDAPGVDDFRANFIFDGEGGAGVGASFRF